jgi:hypothetical protein
VSVSSDDLDTARFEALAVEGRRTAGGRPDRADDTLGQALALWRCEVLAGFPGCPIRPSGTVLDWSASWLPVRWQKADTGQLLTFSDESCGEPLRIAP